MIQVDRIWLFETQVMDPYFFGKIDGVEITMRDERTISLLNLDKCEYYLDSVVKGGFSWSSKYGGEDQGALSSLGKQEYDYELTFDLPLYSGKIIDEITGRLFSVLCERRNGTRFVVLGEFRADDFSIYNEHLNTITLSTSNTSAELYNVDSLNIGVINDTINCSAVSGNLDQFNRMNYDFFPTTKIPSNYSIFSTTFTGANVAWFKGLGALGYEIKWGTDPNNLDQTVLINGGGVESAFIENIGYNTVFYTKIRSLGQFVNSLFSPIISGITNILSAPQSYSTDSYLENQFHASWQFVLGADSYTIEWGTDGVTFPNTQVMGNVNSGTVTGVPAATQIFSRVFATLGINEGDRSNISVGTTEGSTVDPDAQIWIDALNSPTEFEKTIINDAVLRLKADNVFSNLDVLQLHGLSVTDAFNGTANFDGTFNGSIVGGVLIDSLGFETDGATNYYSWGYNPTADATNYLQDDCFFGMYQYDFMFSTGNDALISASLDTNVAVNSGAGVGSYEVQSTGVGENNVLNDKTCMSLSRIDSNDVVSYIDGVQQMITPSPLQALPNNNFVTGANFSGIVPSSTKFSATFAGAHTGTDQVALFECIVIAVASLGSGTRFTNYTDAQNWIDAN